jgi:hypothetical protein
LVDPKTTVPVHDSSPFYRDTQKRHGSANSRGR